MLAAQPGVFTGQAACGWTMVDYNIFELVCEIIYLQKTLIQTAGPSEDLQGERF